MGERVNDNREYKDKDQTTDNGVAATSNKKKD